MCNPVATHLRHVAYYVPAPFSCEPISVQCLNEVSVGQEDKMDDENIPKRSKLSLKKPVKHLGTSKAVSSTGASGRKDTAIVRKSSRAVTSTQQSVEEVEASCSQPDKDRRGENWENEEITALFQGIRANYDIIHAEHHGVGAKAKCETAKKSAWAAITALVNQ